MRFPTLEGSNLEGKEYIIPKTLDKEYNIILMAFWRSQQKMVDTWAPFLSDLEEKYNNFKFYELPTISFGFMWMKPIIDGGMRAGIPNKNTRERTITIYLYKRSMLSDLEIESQKKIKVYLINREGDILWKSEGYFTEAKGKDLKDTLLPKIGEHQ